MIESPLVKMWAMQVQHVTYHVIDLLSHSLHSLGNHCLPPGFAPGHTARLLAPSAVRSVSPINPKVMSASSARMSVIR